MKGLSHVCVCTANKNIPIDTYKLQTWLGSMELSILRLCRMAPDGLHSLQERAVPSAVDPSGPLRTITRVTPTLYLLKALLVSATLSRLSCACALGCFSRRASEACFWAQTLWLVPPLCPSLCSPAVAKFKTALLTAWQASKSGDKVLRQRMMTLSGKPADWKDGRLMSQNNHLIGVWMPVSFIEQRWRRRWGSL